MLRAGWTYEYIASLDAQQLIAAVETQARMREEDINILASLLGVKKRGRK
jgi:hypothetical protein